MALELVRPWSLESPAIGRLSTTNPLAQKVAALVMPAQGYAIVNGVARPLFPPVAVTRRAKFGGYWYASTSGQYGSLGTLRNVASRQRFSIFSTWLSDDGQYQGADASRYIVSCRTAGNAGWSWGRNSAIAGGSDGTVTRQTLVFQGVAAYLETGYAFPSFTETSAGATISASTWLTYKNGVQQESIAVGTMTTGGEFFFGAQDGVAGSEWLDRAGITVIFDDVLSAAEMESLHADPAQLFAPRVFPMPVSAGGGADIDIAGSVGNATAAGVTGSLAVSIDIAGAVADAVAAGVAGSVQVAVEIAGTVGNAVAAGVAGSASVTNDINIDGVVGNAVAAGVTGDTSVGSDISISGTVGNAVAAGTTGVPGVSTTIAAAVGNATAAGVSGLAAIGVLIDGSVGNAAAAGITGTLTLDIVVAGVVANAVAAGVTGSASVETAAVSATPGYTIAAKARRLTITAAARRLEIRK